MPRTTIRQMRRLADALLSPFRSWSSLGSRRATDFRKSQSLGIERLEERWVFTAPTLTSSMPDALTLLNAAPIQVPLDGFDADGDVLTYQVTSSNPTVIPILHEGNRSLRIHVKHDGNGTATDPAFEGDMVFELFEDWAPRTTAHIIQLAEEGFYDGIFFHRIAEQSPGQNFVIQGGDPLGTGAGGSDLGEFDDEFHPDLQHTSVGVLSMAKSNDDTNDSQFFITGFDTRSLDYQHSVFGRLVEGEDIRQKIIAVPVNDQDSPLVPVVMTSVTVFEDTQNKVLTLKSAANTTAGQTATITVTANDGQGGTATKTFTVTTAADTTDNQPFLQPIAPIEMKANSTVTIQLPAIDVDGGSAAHYEVVQSTTNGLHFEINNTTGQLTITASNGLAGVQSVFVGVRDASSQFDTQDVPIYISPAAPTVSLAAASDTGSSATDRVTRLDNSSQANRLSFHLTGVVAGAKVQLFVGTTLIGEGTVATGATSIDITTNGTFDLTDGQQSVTAKQTLENLAVNVGNLSTHKTLASDPSQPVTLVVDTMLPSITSTAPATGQVGAAYTYNAQSPEEGTAGFVYSLFQSPAGATVDAVTGVVSWIPGISQQGSQTFHLRATDPAGNTAEQTFTVNVSAPIEDPPVIAPIGDKTINVDNLLTFTVTATDPDVPPPTLTFSLAPGAPTGATIDAATGVFMWRPNADQAGDHTITVRVTDGMLTTEQPFDVTVVPRPVTFQVINGDLVIPGTAGNDTVTIRGTNVAGRLMVNGTLGDQTVDGVTGAIRVEMGDGNDQITLDNVYVAGPIVLDTGNGSDVVHMGAQATVSSARGMSILLGGGDDQIHIERVYIAGDLTIDGGAGDDLMVIAGVANGSQFWLGSSSTGATTIRGGDGDDSIQVSYSFVVGPWTLDGGSGNDGIAIARSATSREVILSGGEGQDGLSVDANYFAASLVINGNGGSDSIVLKGSIALQSATLIGADGNDLVDVQNSMLRGLMISQGAGQDSAAIRASLLMNFFADLGDGNDMLVLQSNRIFGGVEADGGLGGDLLMALGNQMRPARRRGFEMMS